MLEYALVILLAPLALPRENLIEDLRTCAAIQDSLLRLQCYDKVASGLAERREEPAGVGSVEALAPSPGESMVETEVSSPGERREEPAGVESVEMPAPAPDESMVETDEEPVELAQPTGKWILRTETNPVDGTETTSATLPAVEDGSRGRSSIELVLRCESNQTMILIDWGEYLRSDSPTVTTRVDSLPPATAKWSRSPDKRASIYKPLGPKNTREQRIKSFARQLLGAEKLAARLLPNEGSSVTAVFELHGVAAALKSVRRACGW